MSPWRIFRPFLMSTAVVALMVAVIAAYVAPWGLRELRDWATKVKADFVVNIIQPGRFNQIERGLVLHIRERRPDGQLLGIFIDDRRDPKERVTSISDYGEIIENGTGTFLLLVSGSIQRLEAGRPDPTIVRFDRYAFDLSRFAGGPIVQTLGVRERNIWDLAFPDPNDSVYKQVPTHFRAELHDRLVGILYPFAFMVVCFAILGAPRTSRQSREISMIMALTATAGLRLIGFACNVAATQNVAAIFVLYASVLLALALGLYAIAKGAVLEPPAFVVKPIESLGQLRQRLTQRLAPT
jgi:lipopolysaccharide export system permease protein